MTSEPPDVAGGDPEIPLDALGRPVVYGWAPGQIHPPSAHDAVPRDPRYWCAVHQRPLTYDEAEKRGGCNWCAHPDLLTGATPYHGDAPYTRHR